MKEFSSGIEREISIVENIIRLLNDCLAIALKNRQKEECKKILVDLKHCKFELDRLKGIRAAKEKAAKEETEAKAAKGNAAV